MTEPNNHQWQFWIDRGGTFTDVVARRPDGGIVTRKLLSDNPERYADAALAGIREVLGLPAAAPIPAVQLPPRRREIRGRRRDRERQRRGWLPAGVPTALVAPARSL